MKKILLLFLFFSLSTVAQAASCLVDDGQYYITEVAVGQSVNITGVYGSVEKVYLDRTPPYADFTLGTSLTVKVPSLDYVDGFKVKTSKSTYYCSVSVLYPHSKDTNSAYQKYLKTINIEALWEKYKQANQKEVVVAVIDDGVYVNHEDLNTSIWFNQEEVLGDGEDNDKNGYIDDFRGWNFVEDSQYIKEYGSHGTNVAGVIAAKRDNNLGIGGIASNVKIMPLVACDSSGCITKNVTSAIRYAVDNGAKVINLSLTTNGAVAYTAEYDDAIKYANDHNVLVVAASGNGDVSGGAGYDLGVFPQSPICNNLSNKLNAVIGVAASTINGKYRTDWTNYGTCIDVYAPGENILTTASPIYSDNKKYAYVSGSSFSAPIISGIAAVLMSSGVNVSTIKKAILNSVNDRVIDAEKISKYIKKKLVRPVQISNCSLLKNNKCKSCEEGYELGKGKLSCNKILPSEDGCLKLFGVAAFYNSNANTCSCKDEYKWNPNKTKCIINTQENIIQKRAQEIKALRKPVDRLKAIREELKLLNSPVDRIKFMREVTRKDS